MYGPDFTFLGIPRCDLDSLKEQIRVLKAKINKICKVKPKPRGC
jgi:hypothetical protein